MEEKTQLETPAQQKPLQSIVISNGVRIQSKLNPEAKEFYPSHITRRNQMFHEIIKETKSSEKFLEIISEDAAKETPTEIVVAADDTGHEECEKIASLEPLPPETEKGAEITELFVKKGQIQEIVEHSEVVNEADECKKPVALALNDMTENIVDDKVCGDCLTVNASEENGEKIELEIKVAGEKKETIITECTEEFPPPPLFIENTTSIEVKALLKEIGDDIKADMESNKDVVIIEEEEVLEKIDEMPDLNDINDLEEIHNEAYDKTVAEEKLVLEQKKAGVLKKHSTTIKRVSKIALSSIKKASGSSHSIHVSGDKASAQKSVSSSGGMSRTKRISESLHNLSTTLKSKTGSDAKNQESAAAKLPPRSTTTIPRSAVRSRNLTVKSADLNGLKRDIAAKAKDAISLRSTSSTEKSVTSKSSLTASTTSTSSRKLFGKLSFTSTKSSAGKSTPTSSISISSKNAQDSTQKLPRGTVASSLRQTEAQKVS